MCKYLVYRSNKKIKTPYCKLKKCWNPVCPGCESKEYKQYKPLVAKTSLKQLDKPLKQYTKKRAKTERERYSLFTDNLEKCIECKQSSDTVGHIDKHECIGGRNRTNSMRYGLVVPLCRTHHEDVEIIKKWKVKGQLKFEENYSREEFIKIFGKSLI